MSAEDRHGFLAQVRRPSGVHGPARRAHVIVLLDDGLSVQDEAALIDVLKRRLFTTTAEVIALVEERFTLRYSRSGMIKLLHHIHDPKRLGRLILVMALALYWAVSTSMWDVPPIIQRPATPPPNETHGGVHHLGAESVG